jgi:3-mercaptopyruvate sulfurtransferase SseA
MRRYKTNLLAIIAVLLTALALWFHHRNPTPKTTTWEDVLTEARQGGYRLFNTEDLWQRYQKNSQQFLLVDTRQEWEYRTGHIKGALNFPIEPTWLSRWRKEGALQKLLGLEKNRLIVFY